MPSRSNFNPDQLQAHFDRIAATTGVSLVDDNRMLRFPSGHKFVIGNVRHTIKREWDDTDDPDAASFFELRTALSLHSESGRTASVHMDELHDHEGFYLQNVNAFLFGDDNIESHISWTPAKSSTDGKMRVKQRDHRPGVFSSVSNPTDEQTEELVSKSLQSKLPRDPFDKPGIVKVVTEEDVDDWRHTVQTDHGMYAYNSVRRRYEKAPE